MILLNSQVTIIDSRIVHAQCAENWLEHFDNQPCTRVTLLPFMKEVWMSSTNLKFIPAYPHGWLFSVCWHTRISPYSPVTFSKFSLSVIDTLILSGIAHYGISYWKIHLFILYRKIWWVCCHLYCYECAARVTMPTATNEWYIFWYTCSLVL